MKVHYYGDIKLKTSVLIPNYNNGAAVLRAIDSARGADEIIVYDDGSDTDADTIERERPHVKVIRGERNNGLKRWDRHANGIYQAYQESRGDVIFLLDGDDEFLPGKIEYITSLFRIFPALGFVQHMTLGPDCTTFRPNRPFPSRPVKFMRNYHCLGWIFSETSALVFRREVFQRLTPALRCHEPALSADGRIAQLAIIQPGFTSFTLKDVWGIYHHDPAKSNHSDEARKEQDAARYRIFNRFAPFRLNHRQYLWRRFFSRQLLFCMLKTRFPWLL